MYKSSTYLVVIYFPTYLPIYETYFPTELVTKVKSNINLLEVHPQLRNNGHPVDGVLVGADSLWLFLCGPVCVCVYNFFGVNFVM